MRRRAQEVARKATPSSRRCSHGGVQERLGRRDSPFLGLLMLHGRAAVRRIMRDTERAQSVMESGWLAGEPASTVGKKEDYAGQQHRHPLVWLALCTATVVAN